MSVLTTAEADLAELTKPQRVRFWGAEHEVTPYLIEESLGDGQQLIWLSAIMTRPDYYIVRIDSSWDFDLEDWPDRLEEIYEAIEAECGSDDDEGNEGEGFPVFSSGGSCWGHFNKAGTR